MLYQSTDGIEVALGTSSTESTFVTRPFSDFVLTSVDDPDCMDLDVADTISIPNSNAFIDLDGDCMPDLFLTMTNQGTSYYRVLIQRLIENGGITEHKYCLTATQDQIVESGVTMPLIELGDFNRDSMIDIAFFTPDGTVTVLYN